MRFFLLITAIVLGATLAACSIEDCAYYGGADSSVRCVIRGPAPEGGYQ